MRDTATRLSVSTPAPGISVIEIAGEVTRESDNALREAYEQAAEGARSIVLLVTLLVRAQRNKQQILAYGLSDHYRQIFELTRLDEVIAIHDSEAAALAAAA